MVKNIPASQHGDAARILKSLCDYDFGYAGNADTEIKGRCFNDVKVSAHHAIIPTGVKPERLDEWEKKVYDMIAVRYIIQFFRPYKYNTVDYVLETGGFRFTGKGKAIIDYGWRGVYKADDENDDGASGMVPVLKAGDIIGSASYAIEEKTTTPPKRFTEGTLLAAMTNIWKFLSKDNPNREKLKECKGIGTPATRDTIISELMSSKGNAGGSPCIEKKGKELVPTAFGISMIGSLHSSVTDPESTAVMEYNLSAISEGRMDIGDFMEQTVKMVKENISFAEGSGISLSSEGFDSNAKEKDSEDVPDEKCPICGKKTLKRCFSPKLKKYFWVCEDKNCVHPSTGKPVFYDETRKKPIVKSCPQCGLPLDRVFSKKTKSFYWFCQKCNEFKKME